VSSSRAWGCFFRSFVTSCGYQVFLTRVGVFLHRYWILRPPRGLPHARGGVSGLMCNPKFFSKSSSRAWGCFSSSPLSASSSGVFPTRVGVFLQRIGAELAWNCLPHARGGVSYMAPGMVQPGRVYSMHHKRYWL
jgi:hypothetical protein